MEKFMVSVPFNYGNDNNFVIAGLARNLPLLKISQTTKAGAFFIHTIR
jgi:hypothetical protein